MIQYSIVIYRNGERIRNKLLLYFSEQSQLGIEEFYRGDYFHLESKIYIYEYCCTIITRFLISYAEMLKKIYSNSLMNFEIRLVW